MMTIWQRLCRKAIGQLTSLQRGGRRVDATMAPGVTGFRWALFRVHNDQLAALISLLCSARQLIWLAGEGRQGILQDNMVSDAQLLNAS